MAKSLKQPERLSGSSNQGPELPEFDRNIIRAISMCGDLETALKLGRNYVNAQFASKYGAELADVLLRLEPSEARVKRAIKVLRDLEKELDAQPIQIPAPQENGGIDADVETRTETPVSKDRKSVV